MRKEYKDTVNLLLNHINAELVSTVNDDKIGVLNLSMALNILNLSMALNNVLQAADYEVAIDSENTLNI